MKAFILSLLCILAISCHDTLTDVDGCCENPPQSATFGNASIVLPNIFTPNGDGVNDHWIIYGSSAMINEMKIWNCDNVLVFLQTNFPLNDPTMSWDGKYQGIAQSGMYRFEIAFESFDNISYKTKGEVCSFACDQQTMSLGIDRVNCLFNLIEPSVENPYWEPCFN